MNVLGDFEGEEVYPNKYFVMMKKKTNSLIFLLLENLFLVTDLWKIEREMLHIYTNEIEKSHFVQPRTSNFQVVNINKKRTFTRYVSQRRIVHRTGNSLINKLFIQRKANCKNSIC
jgi:hypothetical protein